MRDLRLRALADAPGDFDTTVDRERARTAPAWSRWLDEGAVFVLEASGAARGLVRADPHRKDPESLFLASMWVDPGFRGTGAAGVLVAALLTWAEARRFRRIWLHVRRDNLRARRFYEKCGFRDTGREVLRERDGVVEVEMCSDPDPRTGAEDGTT